MQLGENCKWKLTIDGKNINLGEGRDIDLDSYLVGIKDQIVEYMDTDWKNGHKKTKQVFYSIKTATEAADDKLTDMAASYDAVKRPFATKKADKGVLLTSEEAEEEEEEKFYVPGALGVTRIPTDLVIGGSTMLTRMDPEEYKNKQIADLKAEITARAQGINVKRKTTVDGKFITDFITDDVTAEDITKMQMDSWPELTEAGTKVHKILEDVFNGKEPTKPAGMEEDLFNDVTKQAKEFLATLKKKHGEGAKFFTEFPIVTDSSIMSEEAAGALSACHYDKLTGVIDLLVRDEKGVCHIYDYKVSQKGVAPEGVTKKDFVAYWHDKGNAITQSKHLFTSTKKLKAGMQVEIYRKMLEAQGLTVGSCTIVPIKLNLEHSDINNPFAITKVSSVVIPSDGTFVVRDPLKNKDKIYALFKQKGTLDSAQYQEITNAENQFFPQFSKKDKANNIERTIDYYKGNPKYVYELKTETKKKTGKDYGFRLPWMSSSKLVTKDELDIALRSAINDRDNIIHQKFSDFTRNLADILNGSFDEDEGLEDVKLLEPFRQEQWSAVRSVFEKYYKNGWHLVSDDDSASLGILVFQKNGMSEVVSLCNENLKQTFRMAVGSSLLGQTVDDAHVNKKILGATHGNKALMRAMSYIASNEGTFTNYPIIAVKAFNINDGTVSDNVSNSQLLYNFRALVAENPTVKLKVSDRIFKEDKTALIMQCDELIDGLNLMKDSDNFGTRQWIQEHLDEFKRQYGDQIGRANEYNGVNIYNEVYSKLNSALLMASGFSDVTLEEDKGDWIADSSKGFFKGGLGNGLMMTSPQFSSSKNHRELGELVDEYAKEVRRQVFIIGQDFMDKLKAVYKKYGTGAKVFDTWFESKEDVILKDPNSSEFDGAPEMRAALNSFLETLCKLRHPEITTQEQLDAHKNDYDYYQVPILEAAFSRQVKGVGFFTAIKNDVKKNMTLTQGLFMGDENSIEGGYNTISDYVSANQKLYNKLRYANAQDRANRLNYCREKQVAPETDLEIVLNAALVGFCRENVSEDYIPLIAAMRMNLERADMLGATEKTKMNNIRKNFDKLVKSKFYGESVMDPNLQKIMKFFNVIKGGFTTLTLSINSRSFLRESLQGVITGMSRAGVKLYKGIDEKHYLEGLTYVIQEAPKNFSDVSMLQQLNSIYGMANQSLSQVAGQRRLNWAGINHWGKDTLFITATAPDFMHRMSLLIAKMKADGSFDAHSVDENGNLVYDWKKDKRFEHFAKGDTSHPDYIKEKSLYITMIEDFNRTGFTNSDGSALSAENLDNLPQAYTREEGIGLKNYADLLYGHYDEESKSLLFDTFGGSLFMQYKTYITAKLEQWTMGKGQYNIAHLEQQLDDNGNEMYVKYYTDEYGAHKNVILKSEYEALGEDEKGKYNVYYDYTGQPMAGMLQEIVNFVNKAVHLDQKGLEEIWKDDTSRAQFMLALHDLLVIAFARLLVDWIFGKETDADNPLDAKEVRSLVRKTGPGTSLAYNVLSGALSDFNPANILQSFTTLNPPAIVALQRMVTSSAKVISGDQDIYWWLTKNVGALGDFQGIADANNKR